MNSAIYTGILQHHMLPSLDALFPQGDGIFQQDNDPKHTAHVNIDYVDKYGINVLKWPSQSPDLNPIENLWSIIDDKIRHRSCNNGDELFKSLQEAWNDIPVAYLRTLVESMPRRCQAVIDKEGYATKY